MRLKAELLNAAGQVLLTSEPTMVDTSFTPTLTAGSYFLRLSALGSGDPLSTGFSTYGSVGNYLITGTLVATSARQAPRAVATASAYAGTAPLAVSFSGQGSSDPDGAITAYRWDFGNGATSSSMNASAVFSTAGTFNAVLTVTDNDGLTGSATVAITVAALANQAPLAVAAASQTTGTAPVAIAFSSAGSLDPDGAIASYLWTFGDGTTSTAANPAKTYTTPGNYTVALRVTDNGGAATTTTLPIAVLADPNASVDLRTYRLASTAGASGATAVATLVVRDQLDRPAAGVSVTVQWSGLVSNRVTGKTDANGQVVLSSGRTKKKGSITGTVTVIAPVGGAAYAPAIYAEPTVRTVTIN